MRGHERHRQVRHRQACLPPERNELLDGVKATLVAERLEKGGTAEVALLTLADPASEESLPERAPHQDAYPPPFRDRKHLALDGTVEGRRGWLLTAEAFQAMPLGQPLGLNDVGGGSRGRPDRGCPDSDAVTGPDLHPPASY